LSNAAALESGKGSAPFSSWEGIENNGEADESGQGEACERGSFRAEARHKKGGETKAAQV